MRVPAETLSYDHPLSIAPVNPIVERRIPVIDA